MRQNQLRRRSPIVYPELGLTMYINEMVWEGLPSAISLQWVMVSGLACLPGNGSNPAVTTVKVGY